ncbi:hypothetical protein GGE65_008217 [Skermanella aerolata]|uniref:hypothetical protein n=1 Tax=Skermanella aerolata TaxID=393310 RepID=UPI003D1A10C6
MKQSSFWEVTLAYLTPNLSHLPAATRATLTADPSRTATPKLSYFAISISVFWLLTFHQGQQVWDAAILSVVVALLQALTVYMVLVARSSMILSVARATVLASALLVFQSIPLVPLESWAYLAQHLTFALVQPGGFGGSENIDYLGDLWTTVIDFEDRVAAATGGTTMFILSVALCTASLLLMVHSVDPGSDPGDVPLDVANLSWALLP